MKKATLIRICRGCLTTQGRFSDKSVQKRSQKFIMHGDKIKSVFTDIRFESSTAFLLCRSCFLEMKKAEVYMKRLLYSTVLSPRIGNTEILNFCRNCYKPNMIRPAKRVTHRAKIVSCFNHFADDELFEKFEPFCLCSKCYHETKEIYQFKDALQELNKIYKRYITKMKSGDKELDWCELRVPIPRIATSNSKEKSEENNVIIKINEKLPKDLEEKKEILKVKELLPAYLANIVENEAIMKKMEKRIGQSEETRQNKSIVDKLKETIANEIGVVCERPELPMPKLQERSATDIINAIITENWRKVTDKDIEEEITEECGEENDDCFIVEDTNIKSEIDIKPDPLTIPKHKNTLARNLLHMNIGGIVNSEDSNANTKPIFLALQNNDVYDIKQQILNELSVKTPKLIHKTSNAIEEAPSSAAGGAFRLKVRQEFSVKNFNNADNALQSLETDPIAIDTDASQEKAPSVSNDDLEKLLQQSIIHKPPDKIPIPVKTRVIYSPKAAKIITLSNGANPALNKILTPSNNMTTVANKTLKISNGTATVVSKVLNVSNTTTTVANKTLKVSNAATPVVNKVLNVPTTTTSTVNKIVNVSQTANPNVSKVLNVSTGATTIVNKIVNVTNTATPIVNKVFNISNSATSVVNAMFNVSNTATSVSNKIVNVSNVNPGMQKIVNVSNVNPGMQKVLNFSNVNPGIQKIVNVSNVNSGIQKIVNISNVNPGVQKIVNNIINVSSNAYPLANKAANVSNNAKPLVVNSSISQPANTNVIIQGVNINSGPNVNSAQGVLPSNFQITIPANALLANLGANGGNAQGNIVLTIIPANTQFKPMVIKQESTKVESTDAPPSKRPRLDKSPKGCQTKPYTNICNKSTMEPIILEDDNSNGNEGPSKKAVIPQRKTMKKAAYKCKVCSLYVKSLAKLVDHEAMTHPPKKPFRCTVCQKAYKDDLSRKVHQHWHTQGKNFDCEFCERSFLRQGTLKTHHRLHAINKNFECYYCTRIFQSRDTINAHIRLHKELSHHTTMDIAYLVDDNQALQAASSATNNLIDVEDIEEIELT